MILDKSAKDVQMKDDLTADVKNEVIGKPQDLLQLKTHKIFN